MSEENRNEQGGEPIDSPLFNETGDQPPERAPKKISLTAFIISAVALVLAAVMLTYTFCSNGYRAQLAAVMQQNEQTDSTESDTMGQISASQKKYRPFDVIAQIFENRSFEDLNEEEMLTIALKAYVYATGDRYADYLTAEEHAEYSSSREGDAVGVGINIVETVVAVNGYAYSAFCVVNVIPGSPAEKAGLTLGDMIWALGPEEDLTTVSELGYDLAYTRLRGAEGTVAEFSVLRLVDGEYPPNPLYFSITRAKVTSSSVRARVSATDPSVGIVKVVQFDLTTPPQFKAAIASLQEKGCDKFVFDLRYNPGGEILSVSAVLSYFLQEGDVLIRTEDVDGNRSQGTVQVVHFAEDDPYSTCNVAKEEIGMYADLDAVVLCNSTTASAGELFVATFMDYGVAPVIGTKTYGKGSVQSFVSLAPYGCDGVLKLTTAHYFSAKRDSYDGIGIEPDEVVELSEEARKQNVYMLPEADDDQLLAAIAKLLGK